MLKPINNKILVELEPSPKYEGSIILPERIYRDRPLAATIVSVGSRSKYDLSEGMRVLVPNYGGLPFEENGKQYKLFTDEEIFGILNDFAEVNV